MARLLAAHSAVNARAHDDMTPLHFSASAGHIAVVRVLADGRAYLDATDGHGVTPLAAAARAGHAGAVAELLVHGALFGSALDAAAKGGDVSTIELLLGKGAPIWG